MPSAVPSVLSRMPPAAPATRANYQQWTLVAAVILVQGTLTLFALRAGSPKGLRYAAAAGGAAIAALGASSVYSPCQVRISRATHSSSDPC